ncbi:MAG: Asp-tRNA(Asn)/Glu-tRNA(Gln) amidotransferase subunit GatC [Vicinamibacterales bacterium]|nr:Asp-tRNA(Asn)/Glu-tRNA(Gln) amidotransferase subunit GatC [Vicinamibacterales bacterium]
MPDPSSEFDVRHLASLARLRLTPNEEQAFSRQLSQILAYARQVLAVPTEGVPSMTHVMNPALEERPDTLEASLRPDEATSNAPDPVAALFRVPKVLG